MVAYTCMFGNNALECARYEVDHHTSSVPIMALTITQNDGAQVHHAFEKAKRKAAKHGAVYLQSDATSQRVKVLATIRACEVRRGLLPLRLISMQG